MDLRVLVTRFSPFWVNFPAQYLSARNDMSGSAEMMIGYPNLPSLALVPFAFASALSSYIAVGVVFAR